MVQVVDTRYQAGRFGSGFKPRPKSDAGIREIPLAPLVVEAIRRQLPPDPDSDALVFTGPGDGNGVLSGTRTILSRHGFRRLYQSATHRVRTDLTHLQLRGPHDLRHGFSTWLEDAGIPARVIDELWATSAVVAGSWRVAAASARGIGTPPRRWPLGWSRR